VCLIWNRFTRHTLKNWEKSIKLSLCYQLYHIIYWVHFILPLKGSKNESMCYVWSNFVISNPTLLFCSKDILDLLQSLQLLVLHTSSCTSFWCHHWLHPLRHFGWNPLARRGSAKRGEFRMILKFSRNNADSSSNQTETHFEIANKTLDASSILGTGEKLSIS